VLLAAGATVNTAGSTRGVFPIHQAAGKSLASLRLLLEAGARVDVEYQRGQTPLCSALRVTRRDRDAQQEGAEANYWVNRVRVLLEAGADANVPNGKGVTPLHRASTLRSAECIRLLLAAGADANAADGDGKTALVHLFESGGGDPMCVELLLATGADPNVIDKEGKSVLLHACKGDPDLGVDPSPGVRCAELLLRAGARTDCTTRLGRTPLHIACNRREHHPMPATGTGADGEHAGGLSALHLVQQLLAAGASDSAVDT